MLRLFYVKKVNIFLCFYLILSFRFANLQSAVINALNRLLDKDVHIMKKRLLFLILLTHISAFGVVQTTFQSISDLVCSGLLEAIVICK